MEVNMLDGRIGQSPVLYQVLIGVVSCGVTAAIISVFGS
jgi:hypothetical protein